MTLPAPIGESIARDRARRLLHGRGRYVDDAEPPRTLHVAFVRSPFAHARIRGIDADNARRMPGVALVATGADLAREIKGWRGTHGLFPALRAPEQRALAVDVARFHGEPVAAVVAESRALAEDAAEHVIVDWEPLPPVADAREAMAPGASVLHPDLGTNIGFETMVTSGDVEAAFARADLVVEETFRFRRHTGLSLETRGIVADWSSGDESLTVRQSHQTPHQQQDLYARLMGIPEHRVRVICDDVGGAFGLKHHLHGDEIAACALSRMLGRPVKFVADRLESLLADIHCRDHEVTAAMAFTREGDLLGMRVDDLFIAGAYSNYPRSSIAEGNQIARLCGGAYRHDAYSARVRMVYQSKGVIGHVRSVGHPIACAVTEGLMDRAAARLDIDPVVLRRRNHLKDADFPMTSAGGIAYERLTFDACLDKLGDHVDIAAFRADQAALRARGIHRGIGIASYVELTAIGPEYYGEGGQNISAQETCLVRLEGNGAVRVYTGVTDQGQGIDTGIQQVMAAALGVPVADVAVYSGDSALCPMGGGSWASRGAALGGEAALRAGQRLKANVLAVAAAVLQSTPDALDLVEGRIVERAGGRERMSLAEVARIGHFRPHSLPDGVRPDFTVTETYAPRGRTFLASNGLHASIVEVDVETGFVQVLKHIVIHDCGPLLNPLLVQEQVRGGVAMGIGMALYEELSYDADGQLRTGSLADYLVPAATEMPEIVTDHVVTPTVTSELGVKGAGEAGTAGVAGALLNAINDALRPFDVWIAETPATPPRILAALDRR